MPKKLNKGDKVTVVCVSIFGETEQICEVDCYAEKNLYLKGHEGTFNSMSGRMFDCPARTKVYIKEIKYAKGNKKKNQ